jgi:hypothetical protein
MKAGDLVRVKDSGVVALVTQIEAVPNFYKSITALTVWAFLSHDERTPVKASKLEVLNASR